jgi:hypothetical protein
MKRCELKKKTEGDEGGLKNMKDNKRKKVTPKGKRQN